MNSADRLSLIRSRLSHAVPRLQKPQGMHRAAHPEKQRTNRGKPKPYAFAQDCRPAFMIYARYTGNERELGQGAEWVAEPVKVPVKPLAHKRTKKVNPLTRIAEQLPMKLKRHVKD